MECGSGGKGQKTGGEEAEENFGQLEETRERTAHRQKTEGKVFEKVTSLKCVVITLKTFERVLCSV